MQDSCEVGVSVGNDSFLLFTHGFVSQDTDASTEDCKTLVDGATLFESSSLCSCLTSFLRTGQVDKVDDGELLNLSAILLVKLLELNSNDCVGPTRGLVHES